MAEDRQERRDRRRVGALLSQYYHFDGTDKADAAVVDAWSNLDAQGFDAQKYFDDVTASGQLKELVQQRNSLDVQVKDLDAKMQLLVYDNYSSFIRATDVIKQMKFTIDHLKPDLAVLGTSGDRLSHHQKLVDDKISTRISEMEELLKKQRNCRTLQALFKLPATLQRCLNRGAYGQAVEAYCNCAGFLRQYRDVQTFRSVLEDVDAQMLRVQSALRERLRSPDLSVDEAVHSSYPLLDLGDDHNKIASMFLEGRRTLLAQSLEHCFDVDGAVQSAGAGAEGGQQDGAEISKDRKELQMPESVALATAAGRAAEMYIPQLCDAVDGMSRLHNNREATKGEEDEPVALLSEFVKTSVDAMCKEFTGMIEMKCPPTRVLVSCIHAVRDALRRLHEVLPELIAEAFSDFLKAMAQMAMKSLFEDVCTLLLQDVKELYTECERLRESKSTENVLGDVLNEVSQAEHRIVMRAFEALSDCQPLLSLLGSDKASCQELAEGIHSELTRYFLAFVDACFVYIGDGETSDVRGLDAAFPALPWSGLYGLALVRMARHLETKAIEKVWLVAKEIFTASVEVVEKPSELAAPPSLSKALRRTGQAMIAHYTLASGQRLAHFFRNSVQSRNWMTVREPREPRLVVDIVLKELYAFDGQLARLLGDPRKARNLDGRRGRLGNQRSSIEIEMERLWAKKLPVFAPIPFNRSGVVVGILRIAFKALYEYMREESFAMYGLQQIQLDCAFLRESIKEFVSPEDAGAHDLDSLLDEVVASASARCVEPVLMQRIVVETLCDEKKRGFKFE
eukprot:TRINITY_DN34984_c0_g1_i1.p1 TRINITY_DN34984_c0_g1~~TRINITY_DN34984_c0_g1_i1.p1  ORF type:complete len:794 (-),score=181.58 TRINITY_DN34984_c0_g1_i1:347-2728(-)